jgi:hypothetical protein
MMDMAFEVHGIAHSVIFERRRRYLHSLLGQTHSELIELNEIETN